MTDTTKDPHAELMAAGTKAEKIGGSYQATGTIVSAFKTLVGEPRYVFEFDTPQGMLHIFGPGQVRARAQAHQIAEPASQWVSVGERLPDESQMCAVELRDGSLLTAWAVYWHGADTSFANWSTPHPDDGDITKEVVRWTLLPKLPTTPKEPS